jgi:hypothetical protein
LGPAGFRLALTTGFHRLGLEAPVAELLSS